MLQKIKKGEMEIFAISQLYRKMKKIYEEAEVEIIEITANDVITASGCQTGGGGENEGEIQF